MKKIMVLFPLLLLSLHFPVEAKPIKVVATTTILEDLTKQIGDTEVDVYTVASPKRNMHHISATPKDVLKVKKAEMLIYSGLQAEPWLQPLLRSAGNKKFLNNESSFVDASSGIEPLEVPEMLSRTEGDVHPGGNPHYWMNPENYLLMIETVTDALSEFAPEKKGFFEGNAKELKSELNKKISTWKREASSLEGKTFISYHRSWSYFSEYFGLTLVGEIEPKPGIPPTGKHIANLVEKSKKTSVDFILKETYFESGTPKKLAKKIGAKVLNLIQFVGQVKSVENYTQLMDYNLKNLLEA